MDGRWLVVICRQSLLRKPKLSAQLWLACTIHEGENSYQKKVADFIIEAGLLDSFQFGADCFLFTTNTRLPFAG